MTKKLSKEELTALQNMVALFRAIDVSSILNAYAIENVVFGDLKPKEKVPFEKFIKDLELTAWQPYSVRDCIAGIAIDFRLAVLSAIHFMNAEHTQLFELKARKWASSRGFLT